MHLYLILEFNNRVIAHTVEMIKYLRNERLRPDITCWIGMIHKSAGV